MSMSVLNPMSAVTSMIPKIQPYNPMSAVTSMIPKIQPYNPMSAVTSMIPKIQPLSFLNFPAAPSPSTPQPASIVSMRSPLPVNTVSNAASNSNYNYIKPGGTVFGPPLLANTNFGLNPGFIQAIPAYQTTDPTQNQYNWGAHPFQTGTTFNSQLTNQVPVVSKTTTTTKVAGPVAPTVLKR